MDIKLATLRELQNLFYFRKIPHNKLQTFIVDIVLVALGVRTGYLFDAFSLNGQAKPPSYILADTIRHLRKRLPAYDDVMILHDSTYDQLFFVNAPLLLKRCREEFSTSPSAMSDDKIPDLSYTSFVLLDDHLRLLHSIPDSAHHILQTLCASMQAQISSQHPTELITIPPSGDFPMQDMIPFTAIVLDYPVAYVPVSSDQSDFLPWEILDVYECILPLTSNNGGKESHVICRFSCPNTLSYHGALQTSRVQERLQSRFSTRLTEAGIVGDIDVRYHQEMHERVVL